MAEPLLTLSTLVDRPTIVIDGTAYPLVHPQRVSVVTSFHLAKLRDEIQRLSALVTAGTFTAELDEQIEATVDEACRLVLQAPPEVHARLSALDRLNVVQSFLELPSPSRQATAGPQRRTTGRARTGARSSRDSSGSTGAPRPAGSTKHRLSSSPRASS